MYEGWSKSCWAPCTSGYQEMKIWPLLFSIISIQGNALLSPSLFELSYPFKIDLFRVPQVLVYCLYDAFIASIVCTTKMRFQFWEQIRRSHIRGIWGMRKDFKPHSVAAVIATCDVWAAVSSCKSRTPRVSFHHLYFLWFPGIAASIHLHNMHLYHATLIKIINHDLPMTFLKLRPSPFLLNEPS